VLVAEVESALERQLSLSVMRSGKKPRVQSVKVGEHLTEQGQEADEIFLLLDGVLEVDVDGTVVAQVGPGAVLGERAMLERGRRTATLKALTPCRVAVAERSVLDVDALRELASGHNRESADRDQ
jgi:CRP-like cAMP-binding protein